LCWYGGFIRFCSKTGTNNQPGDRQEDTMFSIIPINADHVIGIKAEGVLTDDDYKEFLPQLEEFIRREGPISAYVDIEDFKGWKARAAWDDLKFGIAHDIDFKRIAVVGSGSWQQWLIRVTNIFFAADMRFFQADEKDKAMDWLLEKDQAPAKEPATPPPPYGHLLLATDFSPHADLATLRAVELAGRYGAKISIVHVLDNMILYDDFTDPIPFDQVGLYQELEDSSRQLLQKLADSLPKELDITTHLLNGNPGHEILDFAAEQEVDLVVLGSHGRRGLERLLGSVAAKIVKQADCDVLTVHLQG